MNQQSLSSFIWSIADLLRGAYKRADFGKVILPFIVLRRLDLVLDGTRDAVLAEKAKWEGKGMPVAFAACARWRSAHWIGTTSRPGNWRWMS